MANADVLPFDFRSLYKTINGYVNELIELTNQMRESTAVENEVIKTKAYQLANDPKKNLNVPVVKDEVPYLDFSPLQNAMAALEKSTNQLNQVWNKKINTSNIESFNTALYQAEQQLLLANGLPRRSWYKHSIYAPGFYTGYGVKTMPGVREAIEQRNFKEAQEQIQTTAEAINKFSKYLSNIN